MLHFLNNLPVNLNVFTYCSYNANVIAEEDKMDCEEVALKEYHCVICKETSPSKPDMLMGLVVLVQVTSSVFCSKIQTIARGLICESFYHNVDFFQPTNVLGHRRRGNDRPMLPIRDEDAANFSHQQTLAREFQNKTSNFVDVGFQIRVKWFWKFRSCRIDIFVLA